MYKIIFIDLDGTLLNDDKEISDENIKLLNRAYTEKGIKTIIASGRQIGFIKKIYEKYNCHFGDYIIAANGAIIKNIKTNEYINRQFFKLKDVDYIRNIYLQDNLEYFLIYTEEQSFIEFKKELPLNDEIHVNNLMEYIKNKKIIPTICILGGEIKNLQKAISKIESNPNIVNTPISHYYYTVNGKLHHKNYIDIIQPGCDKQNGIKMVLNKFNINNDEMIIIGDGGNDVPMFEYGGFKIAMGNADEIIKEKADYITDTNNNDGVAKAIKRIVFGEE